MRCYDDSGQAIVLGSRLGKGGEGSVYEINGRPNLVAKVYHQKPDNAKSAKLVTMARLKTERLLRLSAWPDATLRETPGGLVVGFLMSRATEHRELHTLYTPKDRLTHFPTAGWPFLIHTASNVARAFAVIHEHGHVIGDVNQSSVYVSKSATVKLIDCDSFQITHQGHQYLCEVGVSTHTPPELQGKAFRSVIRSQNHDAFGLAVLIFQLLFMGRHPFSGHFFGHGEMSLEKAIGERRFAYGNKAAARQMRQPPSTLSLEAVSFPVAALFEKAFTAQGQRPSAQEWVNALAQLSGSLRKCSNNSGHDYFRGLNTCPWCEIESKSAFRLFNIVVAGTWQTGASFDIEAAWNKILAVRSPGPLPDVASPQLPPSKEALSVGRQRRIFVGTVWTVAFGVFGGSTLISPNLVALWLIVVVVVAGVIASTGTTSVDQAKKAAQTKLNVEQAQLRSLQTRWNKEAGPDRFVSARNELEVKRRQYVGLADERLQQLKQLEANREQRQREQFLDQFKISHATIRGIGAGRTATLESYGIETAADVIAWKVGQIPGFGPTLISELITWRQTLERKFVFNPTRQTNPADIAAIENSIAKKRSQLENDLRQGPTTLAQICQQVESQRSVLRLLLEAAVRSVAQTQADLNAL